MEQSYYRIGEVSRATGLSKDTLHFYDKIGLLCPEHVDPRNGYRYYSLRNLWQLDIIAACRKLNIPLDTVRQILSLQDNAQIVDLLMEYRQEALRRSAYYQQVASDILWYQEEHRRIEAQKDSPPVVRQVWREAEQVIAGRYAQGSQAYHVNMQQAAQAELQQVIVPVLSFNHSAGAEGRVRETLRWAVGISEAVMAAATAVFLLAPQALLRIFSASPSILETGVPALRIICLSFLPAGVAMMLTVFFQGTGQSGQSLFVTVLRQVVLLVPLAWAFHFAGLTYVWLTFPVTEVLSVLCALVFYRRTPFLSKRRNAE